MQVEAGRRGLLLPEAGIALDAAAPGYASVVSHAHGDHVPWGAPAAHATAATADFLGIRAPEMLVTPHAWGETFRLGDAQVTFHPSGHILGAALVEVRHDGRTLLYTGDVKLRAPFTNEPCARGIEADVLVVESTFGLPVFRFPPSEELARRLVAFAEESLGEGATPVFLGYNLGKAHEVAKVLSDAGVPTQLHGAAWNLARVYERHGVAFPHAEAYDPATLQGKALIVPPSVARSPMVTNIRNARLAYASGWAALESSRFERGVDALVPISDHCDFPDLLTLVEETRPEEVVCTHGWSDTLAHVLRTKGYRARDVHRGRFDEEEAPEVAA